MNATPGARLPTSGEPRRSVPIGRWLAATRPAFLSITLLAVGLGFSHAWWRGGVPALALLPLLVLTLFGALLAHAGANVLNDVADHHNGSDAGNVERVAPFTGGSRFIQDGLLSAGQMQTFATRLLLACVLCGFTLLALTDRRLLVFGGGGLLLAVAYSLPPLKLMSRGWGEAAVGLAWLLIVAGSDFVLRRQIDASGWLAGLPFALQICLILIANQVPDCAADRRAGKRNWVVRLGPERAAVLYRGGLAASAIALFLDWASGALPNLALLTLPALGLGILAARQIDRFALTPARLISPIRLTLLQAHLVGVLLILSLIADRLFRTTP